MGLIPIFQGKGLHKMMPLICSYKPSIIKKSLTASDCCNARLEWAYLPPLLEKGWSVVAVGLCTSIH